MILKHLSQMAMHLRNSLNKGGDYNYINSLVQGKEIPKTIHQTYPLKLGAMPDVIKRNIENIKKHNPDWEYKLYDDNDIESYISKHFPQLLSLYKKINANYGAARADFFRYLLIYNEGGVYLDIKSNLSKPLNEIIQADDQYILSHWPRHYPKELRGHHVGITNPLGELQQWHIIAVAGHPFLKMVIENVCNNIAHYNPLIHDFGAWGVVNLTGPIAYTQTIYPIMADYPHRFESDHLAVGLVYCAIDARDDKTGHHKVFVKKHYSKLDESIVNLPIHKQVVFSLLKPAVKLIKKIS